jgi:hypothetical protein
MIRTAAMAAWLACGAAAAETCGDGLAGAPSTIQGSRYAVAYVTVPPRIVMGEHFVVEFAVCPYRGAPPPQSVRVDATMPEHRHGMNYRPGVIALGQGMHRAEGLLFHMRGRWELAFDVGDSGGSERLVNSIVLE